jgi:hypothetical protein
MLDVFGKSVVIPNFMTLHYVEAGELSSQKCVLPPF